MTFNLKGIIFNLKFDYIEHTNGIQGDIVEFYAGNISESFDYLDIEVLVLRLISLCLRYRQYRIFKTISLKTLLTS